MRSVWLLTAMLFLWGPHAFAIYGPSLVRAAPEISLRACREADFEDGSAVVQAMESASPAAIADVIINAMAQLKRTPTDSALYPARAFCIHEILPSYLVANQSPDLKETPTPEVARFASLGFAYSYYQPDSRWLLPKNPVDLEQLATRHLSSTWGREAFVMMIQLGWSKGSCQEGPDQFREVIARSRSFLQDYPNSEVSDEIRIALADAYATWWNLSRDSSFATGVAGNPYEKGADEAKERAIKVYSDYLGSTKATDNSVNAEVRQKLMDLLSNPQGSNTFEYYCPDYED